MRMKTIQQMTIEILEVGYSEKALGALVGLEQPSINRIKRGVTKEVGYTTGKAIESVYASTILGHKVAQHA